MDQWIIGEPHQLRTSRNFFHLGNISSLHWVSGVLGWLCFYTVHTVVFRRSFVMYLLHYTKVDNVAEGFGKNQDSLALMGDE